MSVQRLRSAVFVPRPRHLLPGPAATPQPTLAQTQPGTPGCA